MPIPTRIAPDDIPQQTRYQESPFYDEGLYDLGAQTYAWMVPNGSWGESNAGLIVGEGASLLVDTLWDVPKTQGMLDAMAPLTADAPIRTVVNTHADGDHFWGNELLKVETITSKRAYDEMATVQPRSMVSLWRLGRLHAMLGLYSAKQRKIGRYFKQMAAPYDFAGVTHTLPTRVFEQATSLKVGGRAVHLLEVGPAHTQGDLMVYVPDAKLLYTADILFINSTPVMWAGPVTNWIAALDRILRMDVETIVPGHGPITDKNGVRTVKAFWEYVAEKVGEQFRQGVSAETAARNIVLDPDYAKQPFARWNSPERIMVSTHTMYRHLQGRSDHPKVLELMSIMRKQAILANDLPDAQPQVMRL